MLRRIASQLLMLAAALSAQPLRQDTPKIEINPDRPGDVIAIVDGKPFTQLELQYLMVTMSKEQQDAVRSDPAEALRMYGWLKKLAGMAEKQGLDKESPYAQRLEMTRLTLLSEAMLQRQEQNDLIPPEMLKGYFERMKDQYSIAHLKLIFLPYTNEPEELQAKKRSEELHEKLKGGADFVTLVKEFSKDKTTRDKDGDYPPVKRSDPEIPDHVKKVVFSLKPGEFSAPLRLPNGYYLFRLISIEIPKYEEVRDKLYVEVKQQRSREWMQKMRNSVEVKVVAPPKPAQAK